VKKLVKIIVKKSSEINLINLKKEKILLKNSKKNSQNYLKTNFQKNQKLERKQEKKLGKKLEKINNLKLKLEKIL